MQMAELALNFQALPGSPRGAFSFRASPLRKYVTPIVRGPLLSHDLALSNWQRASNFLTVPLCPEHHQGSTGLHGFEAVQCLVAQICA